MVANPLEELVSTIEKNAGNEFSTLVDGLLDPSSRSSSPSSAAVGELLQGRNKDKNRLTAQYVTIRDRLHDLNKLIGLMNSSDGLVALNPVPAIKDLVALGVLEDRLLLFFPSQTQPAGPPLQQYKSQTAVNTGIPQQQHSALLEARLSTLHGLHSLILEMKIHNLNATLNQTRSATPPPSTPPNPALPIADYKAAQNIWDDLNAGLEKAIRYTVTQALSGSGSAREASETLRELIDQYNQRVMATPTANPQDLDVDSLLQQYEALMSLYEALCEDLDKPEHVSSSREWKVAAGLQTRIGELERSLDGVTDPTTIGTVQHQIQDRQAAIQTIRSRNTRYFDLQETLATTRQQLQTVANQLDSVDYSITPSSLQGSNAPTLITSLLDACATVEQAIYAQHHARCTLTDLVVKPSNGNPAYQANALLLSLVGDVLRQIDTGLQSDIEQDKKTAALKTSTLPQAQYIVDAINGEAFARHQQGIVERCGHAMAETVEKIKDALIRALGNVIGNKNLIVGMAIAVGAILLITGQGDPGQGIQTTIQTVGSLLSGGGDILGDAWGVATNPAVLTLAGSAGIGVAASTASGKIIGKIQTEHLQGFSGVMLKALETAVGALPDSNQHKAHATALIALGKGTDLVGTNNQAVERTTHAYWQFVTSAALIQHNLPELWGTLEPAVTKAADDLAKESPSRLALQNMDGLILAVVKDAVERMAEANVTRTTF